MEQFFQQAINGVQLGSIYALIALGYTMVYGVLRLINFAHGDVFMVGAFAGFYAARAFALEEQPTLGAALIALLPVMLLTMFACAVLGLIIERLAYRPLRRAPRLTALITAIGVSLFLVNGSQLVFGADPQFFPSVTPQGEAATVKAGADHFQRSDGSGGGLRHADGDSVVRVQRTRMGKAMRAVSHDADAAALMGINTDTVISFTFALGAALAGAGGVLFAALTYAKIQPLMGMQMGLKAFVAAVVGGIGSIPGAMLGGLLMGLSESFVKGAPRIGAFEPSRWTEAVAFILLIVVLLLRRRVCWENSPRKRCKYNRCRFLRRILVIAATLAILLVLSIVLPARLQDVVFRIVMLSGIAIIMAVSLNLINGFTGQFSIGHAGFQAVGAYASAALTVYGHNALFSYLPENGTLPPTFAGFLQGAPAMLIAMFAGGLLAALVGYIVGLPSLRLRGDYLAIVTLGFGEIIRVAVENTDAVGGPRGFSGDISRGISIPNLANFFWIYLMVIVVIVVSRNLRFSVQGLSYLSVREDEVAAQAMG